MLTSIGASTVSGATLRYVTTSYCGSCIKVLRKDWGKGTKKVKPFAYTPESETGLIKLSGLIYLWAGCSLAETTSLQTGSTKYELGTIAGGRLNPLCHTPSPTTDRLCVSTENAKFQTCATSTHWRGVFHKASVSSGMSLGTFWLCLFFTLQLPPLPQGKLSTKHKSTPGSRLLPKFCSGTCIQLHRG